MVFYDLTSTYFEGEQAAIGKPGYSRDRRGDLDQIVVGIVMSRDGIPLAHHVFEGNRLDKTTVQEVVEDLKSRFRIEKAIMVGNRGMVTMANIEMIKGHEYEYIMGLQKRRRKLIDHLLKKVLEHPQEPLQEFGYSDLPGKLRSRYSEKVRFIAGYNKEVARKTRKTRNKNIARFTELIEQTELEGDLQKVRKANDRLKSFLSKKRMMRLYQLSIEKQTEELYRLKVGKRPLRSRRKTIWMEGISSRQKFLRRSIKQKLNAPISHCKRWSRHSGWSRMSLIFARSLCAKKPVSVGM